MKTFLKKLAIFSIPIWIWIATICLVDPFNLVGSQLVDNQTKRRIAYPLNGSLWKFTEFENQPKTKILLGDSKVNAIKSKMLSDEFYNFAFGGATILEINDAFWFAANHSPLEEVVIGMSFDTYNGAEKKNRCLESQKVSDNKLHYVINQSVIESTFRILKDSITVSYTHLTLPTICSV